MVLLLSLLAAGCVHPGPAAAPPAPPAPPPAAAPAPDGGITFTAEVAAGPITVAADDALLGLPTAVYTIVEWSDIQCPFCGASYAPLASYVSTHPDVRLAFKHYPISGLCNPEVEGVRHENACAAAKAAICASQQGRFDVLAGLMFANQGNLAEAGLVELEKEAGVYSKGFTTCVASPGTTQKITRDVQAGVAAQVEGTPTFFVYGAWPSRWVKVGGGPAAITALIDAARNGIVLPEPTAG